MQCPKCGAEHNKLLCPVCAERKSREAFLALQGLYIPQVLSGERRVALSRRFRSGPYHLVLFDDPTHSYCYERLDRPQYQCKEMYSTGLRKDLCALCLAVFDDVVEREALVRAAE